MATPQTQIRRLSAGAILRYGFTEASLRTGLDRHPHVIGVDGCARDAERCEPS